MFGRKKAVYNINFNTDIHSHLLPGIDDGSVDMEESVEMVAALAGTGLKKLYISPHVWSSVYPNSAETILSKLDELRIQVAKAGIDIKLEAHAEYYVDTAFRKRVNAGEKLLCLPDNHILIEPSTMAENITLPDTIFELQNFGYKPILAHPERYMYYDTIEKYGELKHAGCLFQINCLSLIGYYGKHVKKRAEMIQKEGMIDFIGTDIHRIRQANLMQDAALVKLICEMKFKNDIFD